MDPAKTHLFILYAAASVSVCQRECGAEILIVLLVAIMMVIC